MLNGPTREAHTFRSKMPLFLVAVLLVSMLAMMGFVQYRHSVVAAKEVVLKTDLFRMRDAIHQYFKDKGKYPSSLGSLVAAGYLRTIPQDPITRSTNTWTTTGAGRDSSKPTAEPAVSDVKSGAHGTARDGSKYSEW